MISAAVLGDYASRHGYDPQVKELKPQGHMLHRMHRHRGWGHGPWPLIDRICKCSNYCGSGRC